jgi:hypothetical protein
VKPGILLSTRIAPGAYTSCITSDDIYLDEPYLSIRWDSVHNHVHAEWRAFANSAEFRAGLSKGIQAIRDHRAVAYISDSRKVKVIVDEDQRWIKETWLPLATNAGLKRIGFVIANTGLGRLCVQDVADLCADYGLHSRTFPTMEAARKFVSEVPVSG